jgi:hypothetical protein
VNQFVEIGLADANAASYTRRALPDWAACGSLAEPFGEAGTAGSERTEQ